MSLRMILVILSLAISSMPTLHGQDSMGSRPTDEVDIVRDPYGVPNVFAASEEGAFYGLGWATAEDRLFEMEFVRRLMRGRLAEILSPTLYSRVVLSDKRARLMGFHFKAESMAQRLQGTDTYALLEAYCRGIADSVRASGSLPPIFADFGLGSFEPWTVADCLLAWYRLQDKFDASWEIDAARTECNSGEPMIDPSGAVVPCDYGPPFCQADLPGIISWNDEFLKASHHWAVAGSHTTTGYAVLHGDPQISVQAPSIWYEFRLQGGRFDCRGGGVAGCPGLLVGWNRHIAWGATALGGDLSDVYELDIPRRTPDSYILDGEVTAMTNVHDETIIVLGQPDVTVTYRETVWGPVVTEYLEDACRLPSGNQREFALSHLVLWDDQHSIDGLLGLMKATDWCEAREAMAAYRSPAIHGLYADVEGNIGYTAMSAIPIRPDNAPCWGSLPLDGSLSSSAWQGLVPFDQMPWRFNPIEGFISTANNMAADPACTPFNLVIGGVGDTIRSWRLREILSAALGGQGAKMTPEDILAIHKDSVNPVMRVFTRLALQAQSDGSFPIGSDADLAATALSHWNDGLNPEDHWQCLVSIPIYPLIERTEAVVVSQFRAPEPLAVQYGGGQPGLCNFLKRAERDIAGFAADPTVIAWLIDKLTQGWQDSQGYVVDDTHKVLYQSHLTPLCGGWCGNKQECSLDPTQEFETPLECLMVNTIWSQRGNSYSYFVDFAQIDQSRSVLPPGNDEDPSSPFFRDQESLWRTGDLRQSPLAESLVRKDASSITTVTWR